MTENNPKAVAEKIAEVYSYPDKRELVRKCMRLSEQHTEEKSIRRLKNAFKKKAPAYIPVSLSLSMLMKILIPLAMVVPLALE